ncbi:MAG: hypothetical protein RR661_03480 [Anaerovoracaceae bacterium]
MGERIATNNNLEESASTRTENNLIELTEDMLVEARASISNHNTLRLPIAELSTLGVGVATLIPAFNAVNKTTTIATEGLYQIVNAGAGDVLKVAKNGNFWGSLKTAEGGSKLVQLKAVEPMAETKASMLPINPAMMMMAMALYSIKKDLVTIKEMQKQIISFLQSEKKAEIEADVETLANIVMKYKMNWDNEHYVNSNHKTVLDIQRTARKNMNFYQKEIEEFIKGKKGIGTQNKVKITLGSLETDFNYYRLSLYSFAFASFLEIMLSGNFKEEYISVIKGEIEKLSIKYRELFDKASCKLEKLGKSTVESNVVKGLGNIGKVTGKAIGSIPVIKNGPVDEFLLEKGACLKENVVGMENKAIRVFATLNNPNVGVFVNKMEDMIQIYNHTSQICFDKEYIYLLTN